MAHHGNHSKMFDKAGWRWKHVVMEITALHLGYNDVGAHAGVRSNNVGTASATARGAVVEARARAAGAKKGGSSRHVVGRKTSASAGHSVVETGTRANWISDFGGNGSRAAWANGVQHARARSGIRTFLELRFLMPLLGFRLNVLHSTGALLQM